MTATKEKPILFSSEMVRAILDGRKTQTRRIIKRLPPQPEPWEGNPWTKIDYCHWTGTYQWQTANGGCKCVKPGLRCPYSCDRLWVRETWRVVSWDRDEGDVQIFYRATPEITWATPVSATNDSQSSPPEEWVDSDSMINRNEDGWRPSIHMPRWASRITLERTGVRAERVQEISEADAQAEGLTLWHGDEANYFPAKWDKINGKGAWERNDFVWVVSFRRLEPQA